MQSSFTSGFAVIKNTRRYISGITQVFVKYSNIYPTRCNVTQFIFFGNCSKCFGWYHHPPLGVQTTVSTASGICHTVTRQVAVTVWQMPGAVDTVVCAPNDVWWYHPKHVEQFPGEINCVTLHLVGRTLEYAAVKSNHYQTWQPHRSYRYILCFISHVSLCIS